MAQGGKDKWCVAQDRDGCLVAACLPMYRSGGGHTGKFVRWRPAKASGYTVLVYCASQAKAEEELRKLLPAFIAGKRHLVESTAPGTQERARAEVMLERCLESERRVLAAAEVTP